MSYDITLEGKMVDMAKCTRLLFVLTLLNLMWLADASAQSEWKLAKSREGIEIYLRDVPGSNLQEFKGVVTLANTRLSSLLAAFDDPSTHPGWMYECIDAKVLKKINLHERINYTVTHAPWPVWNRDLVTHSRISQDPVTNTVVITLTGLPDYLPPAPKLVRIPKMSATWTFKPMDGGDIMVIYQMHSEPGGTISPGLANMAVVDLPYYTLYRLRNFIKQDKYANAVYPQVKEPKEK